MEFPEHMDHSMLQTIYSIPSIHSIHSRVSPHPVHCAMRSASQQNTQPCAIEIPKRMAHRLLQTIYCLPRRRAAQTGAEPVLRARPTGNTGNTKNTGVSTRKRVSHVPWNFRSTWLTVCHALSSPLCPLCPLCPFTLPPPCALRPAPCQPSAAVRHARHLLSVKEWLFFVFPVLYYVFNGSYQGKSLKGCVLWQSPCLT